MEFKRQITKYLYEWKNSHTRKPLIIRGARQVGKTTVIKKFSQSYSFSIYLNLEKKEDKVLFDDFDDIKTICEAIFFSRNIPYSSVGETLLFIDEIQESSKAIQLLRYFYEEMPSLHVIAAGSLLEFSLGDVKSLPVGRVSFLYLHPLNFLEYLDAIGQHGARQQLDEIPIRPFAHHTLMNLFHRYAIIGGMPEIIKTDIEINNLSDLQNVYEGIWATYKSDIEKYSNNDTERKVIRHIMDVAALYLDERIKFQGFGNSTYKSREVGECFQILGNAKVVRLMYPTTDVEQPLRPDIKKSPRLLFLDTGLVNYTLGIQGQLLAVPDLSKVYKGAVIPHLVTQELFSLQVISEHKPLFWVRDKKQSQAEVDLLVNCGALTIPVEIKSGSTGTLKSLHQFMDAVDHIYAVRVYGGDFKVEQTKTAAGKPFILMNLPYYLGTKIPEYVDWFVKNNGW